MENIITVTGQADYSVSFTSPRALELWLAKEGYQFKIKDLNTIVAIDDVDNKDLHLHVSYTQLLSTEDMEEKMKEPSEPEPEIERGMCPKCFGNMVRISTHSKNKELWKCVTCGHLTVIGGETDGES